MADNVVEIVCSRGPGAVTAVNEIADRIEGKPRQELAVSDITRDLREKSDAELMFHLEHGRWREDRNVRANSRAE